MSILSVLNLIQFFFSRNSSRCRHKNHTICGTIVFCFLSQQRLRWPFRYSSKNFRIISGWKIPFMRKTALPRICIKASEPGAPVVDQKLSLTAESTARELTGIIHATAQLPDTRLPSSCSSIEWILSAAVPSQRQKLPQAPHTSMVETMILHLDGRPLQVEIQPLKLQHRRGRANFGASVQPRTGSASQ
ncbi:hypothetical protein D3C77_359360 [compost metagenome]